MNGPGNQADVEADNRARLRAAIIKDRRLGRAAWNFFGNTPEGRELLRHFRELAAYDEPSFSPATNWNTHHAALIEGARQQVRVILGLMDAHEQRNKQNQEDE